MARPLRIGIYSPFFGSTYGGGEKYLCVTAEALRDGFPEHHVELLSPLHPDVDRYQRVLGVDLSGIEIKGFGVRGGGLGRRLRKIPGLRRYADLYLSIKAAARTRPYDLLLSMVYVMPAFSKARRGVILCQFPSSDEIRYGGLKGVLYRVYTLPYNFLRDRLLGRQEDAFQVVVAQSEYTRYWVQRYWHRDAAVVNPPIDVPEREPVPSDKAPIVLSVGRFFAGGHNKRHDVMARAFRQLCDEGLSGWELHLVGSLHTAPADQRYFAEVKALAEGYPIHVHADASLEEVRDLYRRASVYWHAAGYGVDAEVNPIQLEHFGMTTVEAMGQGVVPVAIARGGQVEVVDDGVDGYLWREIEELKQRTLTLIGDGACRERMAEAARRSSFRFSRDEFKRHMVDVVRPLVEELQGEAMLRG
jgi:glycosyltransferase involved in cell wall biosynthesis